MPPDLLVVVCLHTHYESDHSKPDGYGPACMVLLVKCTDPNQMTCEPDQSVVSFLPGWALNENRCFRITDFSGWIPFLTLMNDGTPSW